MDACNNLFYILFPHAFPVCRRAVPPRVPCARKAVFERWSTVRPVSLASRSRCRVCAFIRRWRQLACNFVSGCFFQPFFAVFCSIFGSLRRFVSKRSRNISRLSLHPATRLSLALPASSTSSIVSKMMRLARQLNVPRTSARLMSTHVQPSLTQFETSLTENARQLLGNDSPTTVLPLAREVRCRALDSRRPPAATPYVIRATHSPS